MTSWPDMDRRETASVRREPPPWPYVESKEVLAGISTMLGVDVHQAAKIAATARMMKADLNDALTKCVGSRAQSSRRGPALWSRRLVEGDPMMSEELVSIDDQIRDLALQRGFAALHKKPVEPYNAQIAALKERQEIERDVETAKAQVGREALTAEQAKMLKANQAKLATLIDEQTTDYEAAEAAARALAAAAGRIIERNLAVTKASRAITGTAPLPLQPSELVSRLACRLSAVMSTSSPNHRHRFGSIMWHPGALRHDQSWRDAEAAILATHFNPILGKE